MVCKRKCCTAYATESVSDSPLSHAQLSGITTSHIDPREVGHKTVETVHKMRSLNDASASWQEFKRYQTIEELKEAVRLEGRTSAATRAGLRSACWKAFLLFENVATSSWLKTLGTTRSAYDSLSVHFLHNSNDQDGPPISIDPLSETTTNSSWLGQRKDDELRAEIEQDVKRCMTELEFFRQDSTQLMMCNILFVYCKLNPDLSYRQGMHELLAPILWVVDQDAVDLGQSSKALGEDVVVRAIFDPEHIEHDTFALFGQVMQGAKIFYEQTTHISNDNPIVIRSRHIFNDLLPQVDDELARHLAAINVVPQVFLLRWIRLLFGREFSFDDMLSMWDIIFAEDASLELVDNICVAMLLRIRWELLEADYNTALTILLRYPQPRSDHPGQTFVFDALYLRSHMTVEGGSYLVLKYTDRPLQPTHRPLTPPALQRNITAFSGANALKAVSSLPRPSSRQQRNIEAMFHSTAQNIYSRGERLGIGKAVRSAVSEVQKKAQEIRDTPAPSPPNRRSGGPGRVRSFESKVRALEARNKQLSGLLGSAVSELWAHQKLMSDTEYPSAGTESADELEKLSLAIAKVQFVQVYLEDSSLPLPEAEDADATENKRRERPDAIDIESDASSMTLHFPNEDAAKSVSPFGQSAPQTSITDSNRDRGVTDFGLVDPDAFEDPDMQAVNHDSDSIAQRDATRPDARDAPATSGLHAARPSLAQSSYSWMLGQEETTASPPTRRVAPPAEPITQRRFLFGDESATTTMVRPAQRGVRRKNRLSSTSAASQVE